MEQPVVYWVPSIAVCAIDFSTGDRFPRWRNDLLVSSLAAEELRRVVLDSGKSTKQEVLFKGIGRVRDVVSGPDGLVYVAFNGPDRVARLVHPLRAGRLRRASAAPVEVRSLGKLRKTRRALPRRMSPAGARSLSPPR